MHAAISAIRTHDTHKLLSAKAAFLRLSPDEKARFARFFEAEAPSAEEVRRQRSARELEFARRVQLSAARQAKTKDGKFSAYALRQLAREGSGGWAPLERQLFAELKNDADDATRYIQQRFRGFKFLGSFSAALSARPLVFFHR